MPDQDWRQHDPARVLFLLDSSHAVETRALEQWLEQERRAFGLGGDSKRVTLPISATPENIPSGALWKYLDLPEDTLLVPLRVVWISSREEKGSAPRLRDLILGGNPRRPGPWRARRILRRDPGRARCIEAEPATLGELRERHGERHGDIHDSGELADFIAGQAGLALDVAERRLRGSRYKVPRRVAASMMADREFRQELEELSRDLGRPLADIQEQAEGCLKEMLSRPSTFWIDIVGWLSRRIRTLGYDTDIVIDQQGLERTRQSSREYPCVFLFTHKTHVDGFAHISVLYENDFPAPHTLGGDNMAFAGLGFILRRAGAIFIRRSFADDLVYKAMLRRYIAYLMEKRFSLSWAFEGTRSRVGKLMPPRYGLLKYVIEAAHGADIRNLHIIPVAINYDLIGDVKDYAIEESGTKKRPESLRWFVGYLRGLSRPMGRIYMDYCDPVVLEQSPDPEDRLALAKVAFQVGVGVNRRAPVTLSSLMTMVLLGAAPRALTRDELLQRVDDLVNWCRDRDIRLTDHFEPQNRRQLADLFSVMVRNGLITEYRGGHEDLYAIIPEQHIVASYYRNATIHYFVDKAIAELALVAVANVEENRLPAFWAEAERLRDLFKFEFFYSPTEEFRQQVWRELEHYHPGWEGWLEQDRAAAERLLAELTPYVAHSAVLPYVEAYRVVADTLAKLDDSAGITESECVTRALAYGRQYYLQRRISSQASIGKLLFQNGYKLMANRGLTEGGGEAVGAARRDQSRAFRELAFRLDRIRVLAQPL